MRELRGNIVRWGWVAAVVVATASPAAAAVAAPQDCVKPEVILWGDGRHDDTAALSAWLRGAGATWAISGKPVGARIVGRSFRLSTAVYVSAGTGRQLKDFRLLFPTRGEIVSGGTIIAGDNPNEAPVISGVTIHGGDSGEGVPFELPDRHSGPHPNEASCAIS